MVLLSHGGSFSAFPPEQLQALALLFLTLFKHGFSLALVLFGLRLLLLGVLLSRAASFPRVFGPLIAVAGASLPRRHALLLHGSRARGEDRPIPRHPGDGGAGAGGLDVGVRREAAT